MNKLVSVIIPSYNAAKYIAEAIDSVRAQTYQPVEIIVIDDGSTDATREVLRPYIEAKTIIYIHQENKGTGAARNAGIKVARGEFIALLDADDVWQREKLAKQIPLFADANVHLVYSDAEFFGSAQQTYALYSQMTGELSVGAVADRLIQKNFIPASTVVARKLAIERAGMFSEDRSGLAIEDYHLWLKIAPTGQFKAINEPLMRYRIHPEQTSKSRVKSYKRLCWLYADFLKNRRFGYNRFTLVRKYFVNATKVVIGTLIRL